MGEQRRLGRQRNRSFHVHGHRDFLDHLAQFDQLGGAGGGVGFQLAAFCPAIGIVVAPNVAEDHILAGAVEDDAQVEVDARRPEVGISGIGQLVNTQTGMGRVGLQIKGRGLGRPLMVIRACSHYGC